MFTLDRLNKALIKFCRKNGTAPTVAMLGEEEWESVHDMTFEYFPSPSERFSKEENPVAKAF